MAAAVFTSDPGAYCERIENFGRDALLRIGLGSGFAPTTAEAALGITQDMIRDQCLQLATRGYVEFEGTMSADTNTAGVVNLTEELGIDFLTAGFSRRIDVECVISADVDKALVKEELLIACASTPIVYRMLQGFTADAAAATNARAVGAGDLSVTVLASAAVVSQSSNDVILTLTGVSNIDTRWVYKIRVYPKLSHVLIATT